ncbi:MAG TPA: transcription elongation factor GreA [Actinopolymorphaceae bacterium]
MTQSTEENVIWLTKQAYDRLKAELEHLTGPVRTELSRRIGEARDEGDLSENGGYHAAREEQGKTEARIRKLQDLLRRAKVGDAPPDDGIVEPGMTVTVRFAGDDDTETFLLGSRELLTLDESVDMEVYSPESPLGRAINGKRKGETTTYTAPNGREVSVEIIDTVPFGA